MAKWAQGKFNPKFPEKYVGGKTPTYRSSWEFAFMRFCDEHPSVRRWASEAIKIPYKNPFTGKMTIYVPDFFIEYIDKNGKSHVEVIEVKPSNQTNLKEAKRSQKNSMHWVLNQAKWEVARQWCKQKGIVFRVINEGDIFHK
jgi:hypothetical protein